MGTRGSFMPKWSCLLFRQSPFAIPLINPLDEIEAPEIIYSHKSKPVMDPDRNPYVNPM